VSVVGVASEGSVAVSQAEEAGLGLAETAVSVVAARWVRFCAGRQAVLVGAGVGRVEGCLAVANSAVPMGATVGVLDSQSRTRPRSRGRTMSTLPKETTKWAK